MFYSRVRVLLAAVLCTAALPAFAGAPVKLSSGTDAIAVPPMINYQGRLTDGAGQPVNGTRDMTFKLYAESTGGTAVWSETQAGVVITSGLFNALLGSVTPINALPDGPGCYLEITVAGELIVPRVRVASAGYSFKAASAENAANLGGVPASGYVRGVTASSPLASTGGQTPNLTLNTAMGGDLTGSYPNPSLTTTGVTAGTYGADTLVPRLTVDAKGRVSSVANVRVGGSAATYPNANIFRYGYPSIYTVPTGKSFLLYGVAIGFYGGVQIDGTTVFYSASNGSGLTWTLTPPMQLPAGTVFATTCSYGASVYGCEF